MYAIASRVGSRCQYICASCVNTTIQGAENVQFLLRQNSTSPATDITPEECKTININLISKPGENNGNRRSEGRKNTKKIKATSLDPLSSWLQKVAENNPKAAAKVSKSVQKGIKSRRKVSKSVQKANQAVQLTKPLKASSLSKGLPEKHKLRALTVDKAPVEAKKEKKPATINGAKKSNTQEPAADKAQSARRKSAKLEARDISNGIFPCAPSTVGRKREVVRRKSPAILFRRVKLRPLPAILTRRVTRFVRSDSRKSASVEIELRVSSKKHRRKTPLLTRLYSITTAYADRVWKKMLMSILERNMLNSHGIQLARGDEGVYKDAAYKEIKGLDKALSVELLTAYKSLESALKQPMTDEKSTALKPLKGGKVSSSGTVHAQELKLVPIEKPQPPVPGLVCGLERVLFNHGVYQLRDHHSRVYNFDPYLEYITPVKEFDYDALKEYITSSRDTTLIETAATEGRKYTGSTSSMTSALAHFHYLLSKWRPVNLNQLSRGFPDPLTSFTTLQRAPAGIFLRRRGGVYAIDANKGFDTSNVLQWLGKSMEKFLTLDKEDYIKYRKEHSHKLTDEDKNSPESFHYTIFGDFLMRSQLDAYDPRLPGTGMYDLKTRAVVSIRKDAAEYEGGLGYEIKTRQGEWESYEREYYDMCRAAFLKYSLQVRMGRMDGVFVAFHNTERIFGFQYLPLPELDEALHGTTDTTLGDSEFKVSLQLLNKVLDRATEKFPEDSLQIQFETRPKNTTNGDCFMYIFVRPVTEEAIQSIQETNLAQMQEYEKRVIGLHGNDQIRAIRAVIEDAAKAAEADERDERLEAAFDNLDEPMSVEIIRKAVETIKGGTLTEKAMSKMLDLIAARAENDEPEALADDAKESSGASGGEPRKSEADEAPMEEVSENETGQIATGPIMVLKLNIRNFVNSRQVLRPDKLMPGDKWDVSYSLEEITTNKEKLYDASLARRKSILNNGPPSTFGDDGYANHIQRNVNKGKTYRQEMDRLDEKHGVTVYDKQEFLDFESLQRREEGVRKEVQEEIKELESLKRMN